MNLKDIEESNWSDNAFGKQVYSIRE